MIGIFYLLAFKFHTLPNMKRTVSDPSSILLQVDKDTPRRLTPNRSHGDLATHAVDQRNRIYSDKYYTTSHMSHSGDSCSTTSSASSDPSSPAVTDSPSDTANMHNVPYYMTPSATSENFFFPGNHIYVLFIFIDYQCYYHCHDIHCNINSHNSIAIIVIFIHCWTDLYVFMFFNLNVIELNLILY